MIAATSLLVLSSASAGSNSGAAEFRSSTTLDVVGGNVLRVSAPEKCPSARLAVQHFRALTWTRQRARQAELADRTPIVRGKSCRWARYAAAEWQARARSARRELVRWQRIPKLSGETAFDVSMRNPVNRNLYRLAVCETGGINGGRPLWTHHNSTYSGALGFAHSTWAHWRHYVRPLPPSVAAHASPAEQLAVGRALVRTFGGYSSWPACHRRLGLG